MVKAVAYVYNRPGIRLIGPNCPGIITPGENGGAKDRYYARSYSC